MENIKKLVEDLRGLSLPLTSLESLKINDELKIYLSYLGERIHRVYRIEFDGKDWDLRLGTKVLEAQLTFCVLDNDLSIVLNEIEISLSYLLNHLKELQQPVIKQRKAEIKSTITKLQNELNTLEGLEDAV